MDNITVKLEGNLVGKFEDTAKRMPSVEKYALYQGAAFLRDKIKESLTSKLPKATQRNPKYNDTLEDAVRFTKVDGASLKVHALGTRAPGSGTYRTRFFEEGTVERFHKKRNGIKLKKKKSVGKITPLRFFSSSVQANKDQVVTIMEDIFSKYVQRQLS